MIIKRLVVGPLEENAYVVGDENSKKAMVIDPGDEPDRIIDVVNENNLDVTAIVCTHGHFDHIGAVGDIKKQTGAKILIHQDDLETYNLARDQAALWGYTVDELPEPDGYLSEGDSIEAGNLQFKVLHTPGHSPGGICLYGGGTLFTGDTIFKGSVGRTDFPGGSIEKLGRSFRRLLEFPDDVNILSGHGPETTVGIEKTGNPFVNDFL